MEIHPLLFIASPVYIQEKRIEIEEESTSIYVRPTTEKIENALIARQLHYFSKPAKEPRVLVFILQSGEKIHGSIDKIIGSQVLLNYQDTKRWIKANEIVLIHNTL
ncbi:4-diphosphocytidyl-2C-methyl-D-erythritol kinase [Solibacillus sp. NPDC093137]|uniref:4-diphosphocytidyl-2C-methyl-D-erythritol kinase n=1 Tax=Solibacillus sp. NPDC093137 TaxID=3390678 RepID=UPI003D0499C2